jgi:hypothetical protein
MTKRTFERCRYLLFLVAAFSFFGWHGRVAAAPRIDNCSDMCGSDFDCLDGTSCLADDHEYITDCADYNGGPAAGSCDGNSCPGYCGPWADPGQGCYSDNQLTDCYSMGEYEVCGDSICAGAETPCNCPADCGDQTYVRLARLRTTARTIARIRASLIVAMATVPRAWARIMTTAQRIAW